MTPGYDDPRPHHRPKRRIRMALRSTLQRRLSSLWFHQPANSYQLILALASVPCAALLAVRVRRVLRVLSAHMCCLGGMGELCDVRAGGALVLGSEEPILTLPVVPGRCQIDPVGLRLRSALAEAGDSCEELPASALAGLCDGTAALYRASRDARKIHAPPGPHVVRQHILEHHLGRAERRPAVLLRVLAEGRHCPVERRTEERDAADRVVECGGTGRVEPQKERDVRSRKHELRLGEGPSPHIAAHRLGQAFAGGRLHSGGASVEFDRWSNRAPQPAAPARYATARRVLVGCDGGNGLAFEVDGSTCALRPELHPLDRLEPLGRQARGQVVGAFAGVLARRGRPEVTEGGKRDGDADPTRGGRNAKLGLVAAAGERNRAASGARATATRKPAYSGVDDRTSNSREPEAAALASRNAPSAAALMKPGTLSDGIVTTSPSITPKPPAELLTDHEPCERPPITGSFSWTNRKLDPGVPSNVNSEMLIPGVDVGAAKHATSESMCGARCQRVQDCGCARGGGTGGDVRGAAARGGDMGRRRHRRGLDWGICRSVNQLFHLSCVNT
eukprot:scaffold23365_cov115-Isochrysis_galbana.AAC.12